MGWGLKRRLRRQAAAGKVSEPVVAKTKTKKKTTKKST